MRSLPLFALALALSAGITSAALGQPALPQPPLARVPVERLATMERGAFLESIAVTRDGSLLIADHHAATVLRMRAGAVRPAAPEVMARLDGLEVTGLALDLDDTLYVTARPHGAQGGEALYRVRDGRAEPWVTVPEGRFLNGATLLRPGVFLVADSFAGAVWRVDVRARTVTPWLRHAALGPNPAQPRIPGANGVKLHGGHAYVSNSGQARVLRIPIRPDGSAGEPESWAEGVVVDDFAMAANGDLYGTTHIFDSVVVLRQDGTRATIATAADGVTGSTAAAFGVTETDRDTLYVVGDGGAFLPPPTGVVPAEVVRLRVGARGLGRDDALSWVPRPAQVAGGSAMMVRCETASGTEHLRAAVGPAYLRYLELNEERLVLGGQVFDDPTAAPVARIYMLRGATAEEARAYVEASPYYRAGMYSGCAVHPFGLVLGAAVGGVTWPEAATRPRP